jgi:hypothetical protein
MIADVIRKRCTNIRKINRFIKIITGRKACGSKDNKMSNLARCSEARAAARCQNITIHLFVVSEVFVCYKIKETGYGQDGRDSIPGRGKILSSP